MPYIVTTYRRISPGIGPGYLCGRELASTLLLATGLQPEARIVSAAQHSTAHHSTAGGLTLAAPTILTSLIIVLCWY